MPVVATKQQLLMKGYGERSYMDKKSDALENRNISYQRSLYAVSMADHFFIGYISLYANQALLNEIGDFSVSYGPSPIAMRWANPNLGAFLAHESLEWLIRHILLLLYIFAVFSSNSGTAIFWSSSEKRDRNAEPNVELIFMQVTNEPPFSKPPSPFLVRLQLEPIIVCILVVLHIWNDKLISFLCSPITPDLNFLDQDLRHGTMMALSAS